MKCSSIPAIPNNEMIPGVHGSGAEPLLLLLLFRDLTIHSPLYNNSAPFHSLDSILVIADELTLHPS